MIVLGLDASSDAAAVGLMADGRLLCEYTLNNGKNHSVKLLPAVENMLRDTGLCFSDIDVYACGVGPGSFTGVRIGVATVKGFAQSWEKPTVAMSSLQLLAENIRGFDGLRVAAVCARADELYCAAYNAQDEAVLPPSVLTVGELSAFLSDKACMTVGDVALQYEKELSGKGVQTAWPLAHTISGGAAAGLGYRLAQKGELISYCDIAPMYLRASQAEREYLLKHEHIQVK